MKNTQAAIIIGVSQRVTCGLNDKTRIRSSLNGQLFFHTVKLIISGIRISCVINNAHNASRLEGHIDRLERAGRCFSPAPVVHVMKIECRNRRINAAWLKIHFANIRIQARYVGQVIISEPR